MTLHACMCELIIDSMVIKMLCSSTGFDRVTPERLGATCLIHAISGILEYYDLLPLTMEYLDFGFYYNREILTDFSFLENPEYYLEPENPILFKTDTDLRSAYKEFYCSYMYSLLKSSKPWAGLTMTSHPKSDALYVLQNCAPPFILYTNIEPLQKEFKNLGGFFDTGYVEHWLAIYGENAEGYWVKDKHYHICGLLNKKKLFCALDSLSGPSFSIMSFNPEKMGINHVEPFNLVNKNFQRCIQKTLKYDNISYLSGPMAINQLQQDMEHIIVELDERFGKYAPQFFSYPTIRFRQQQTSYSNALRLLHTKLQEDGKWSDENAELYEKILAYSIEISKRWWALDGYIDMVFLRHRRLSMTYTHIEKSLSEIYNKTFAVISLMEEFVEKSQLEAN